MALVRRLLRVRTGRIGVVLVLALLCAALLGPLLIPYSPIAIDHHLLGNPQPPTWTHPLGTDVLGRDELSRALSGARVSLFVGVTAMLVAVVVGTFYGAIAGAAGGLLDMLMMRLVDALLSFPSFFLIVSVEALTNRFTLGLIVLVIGLLSWMGVARLVRAEVLSLRERDFVEAARAIGASPWRVILRHLIPNALAPVIVAGTLAIGDNILTEAGLSYLGLGVQIPTPSWGNMLQDALTPTVLESAPWLVLTPGLLIVGTLLSFGLVGDALQAVFGRRSVGHGAVVESAAVPAGVPAAGKPAAAP
jgi:peptide/nickel transport system permease protein